MTSKALQIGDLAPEFELPDDGGGSIRLSELRGQRLLIFFYPKDDTSGCTRQACGLRDGQVTVDAAGARVLGISPDGVDSHRSFRAKYDLPFNLLVDADHAVAEDYGAWGEKSMYGNSYEGIIRSHFVIGPDGRIEDAQINVSPVKSVELGLAFLESAAASEA